MAAIVSVWVLIRGDGLFGSFAIVRFRQHAPLSVRGDGTTCLPSVLVSRCGCASPGWFVTITEHEQRRQLQLRQGYITLCFLNHTER